MRRAGTGMLALQLLVDPLLHFRGGPPDSGQDLILELLHPHQVVVPFPQGDERLCLPHQLAHAGEQQPVGRVFAAHGRRRCTRHRLCHPPIAQSQQPASRRMCRLEIGCGIGGVRCDDGLLAVGRYHASGRAFLRVLP
jgi:hypothetical protein